MLECKAQSFSATSSTAAQCRKLLIACGDPNTSLGATGKAYVIYVLPEEDVDLQNGTLKEITVELVEHDLNVAQSGTLGLSLAEDGLWAELAIKNLAPDASPAPLCDRLLVVEGTIEEARPLYLIPFDPAAENEQAPEERRYCARMLAERLFNQAISIIGRAELPACARLPAESLLDGATFGVSSYWETQELSKFKTRIAKFMYKRLNRGQLRGKVNMRHNTVVELELADEPDRSAAISMLQKANPETFIDTLLDAQHDAIEQIEFVEFE